MVNTSIKVFARIKNNNSEEKKYVILKDKNENDCLAICTSDFSNSYNFSFKKIFDEHSNQSIIFEEVAKPVVENALQGFNGTIFAYGMTGSGKTYSITGSPRDFNERGMIPRSIEHIFKIIKDTTETYSITVSYLEIYNEIAYDLLRKRERSLGTPQEHIPRVHALEGKEGDFKIRNLNILPVSTAQDALKLLVLGEHYRTTGNTRENERSSRSHCIFTIYLKSINQENNLIKYSKLHIVDLAGSERVYKNNLRGVVLNEAKHINLSLHFLEHVILSLAESRKHIPYRNCLMTYLLKDSFTGNCVTVMLATLNITNNFMQETVSTCKFSQRVALVNINAEVNQISSSEIEVEYLKSRVLELELKLKSFTGKINEKLTLTEEKQCLENIYKYLENEDEYFNIVVDMKLVSFYFKTFKKHIISQTKALEKQKKEIIALRNELKLFKENNCHFKNIKNNDLSILDYIPHRETEINKNQRFLDQRKENLFKEYMFDADNVKKEEIQQYVILLNNNFEKAKLYSATIEECQRNINYIKETLVNIKQEKEKACLLNKLSEYQNIYKMSLEQLEKIKKDTENIQYNLNNTKVQILQNFKNWLIFNNKVSPRSPKEVKTITTQNVVDTLRKQMEQIEERDIHKNLCVEEPQNLKDNFIEKGISENCTNLIEEIVLNDNKSSFKIIENDIKSLFHDKVVQISNDIQNINNIENNVGQAKLNKETNYKSNLKNIDDELYDVKINTKSIEFGINGNANINTENVVIENSKLIKSDNLLEINKCMEDREKKNGDTKTNAQYSQASKVVNQNIEDTEEIKKDDAIDSSCTIEGGNIYEPTDTEEFKEFIRNVQLTGTVDVDKEILEFYRNKFK